MSYWTIGPTWAGAVDLPKDEVTDGKDGRKAIRVYRALWATWDLFAPTYNAPHPLYNYCYRRLLHARKIEPGVLADVTVNYEQTEAGILDVPPDDDRTENGSTTDVPIEFHPDFNNQAKYPDSWKCFATVGGKKLFQGWDMTQAPSWVSPKYAVGSSSVSITRYTRAEPDDVQGDLGTRQNPSGFGSAGHWLVITGSKNKQGKWWARTLVYLYSETPWPTVTYPN